MTCDPGQSWPGRARWWLPERHFALIRAGRRRGQPRMLIQIGTDQAVHGDEALIRHFEVELATRLSRFSDHITRLEAHFSEETADDGQDRCCVLEARPAGRRTWPSAITRVRSARRAGVRCTNSRACSRACTAGRITARAGTPSGTRTGTSAHDCPQRARYAALRGPSQPGHRPGRATRETVAVAVIRLLRSATPRGFAPRRRRSGSGLKRRSAVGGRRGCQWLAPGRPVHRRRPPAGGRAPRSCWCVRRAGCAR